jgi:epoxyqueuosine reductase
LPDFQSDQFYLLERTYKDKVLYVLDPKDPDRPLNVSASGSPKGAIKGFANSLGFDLVGITTAEIFERGQAAEQAVSKGLLAGLPWFTRERVRKASRPREALPGAQSVIALGISYYAPNNLVPVNGLHGRVARYAHGRDYHTVVKKLLKTFVQGLSEHAGVQVRARFFVDDGPMLDRAAAERAGIGWYGKNTNILTATHGSWVFLAVVVTDLELEPDPHLRKTCGACRLCLDACPTGAFVGPYILDNQKCISYQTIENRGPIPVEMRSLIGDWIFGCDICQDVCPVNRKARPTSEPNFVNPERATLELTEILSMTEDDYQDRFRGSPIKRATLIGLQRNACVALGNIGGNGAVPTLTYALLHASSPLIRGHAAWALARIGGAKAHRALKLALRNEDIPYARDEIDDALVTCAISTSR